MAADLIVNKGRIRYMEPTLQFTGKKTGTNSDSINFPYEDYGMAVELCVRSTNRYSCGLGEVSGEFEEEGWSSVGGNLSFFGGTKYSNSENAEGYLTTNFTDISMEHPDENTEECLGIESIEIQYQPWMYPTVNIKFVDVRGATVMQQTEENYYTKKNKKESSLKRLYRLLFAYPYPTFTLKVKGYYGKGVTFKLVPQKTSIDFDANSGNFNITATFIGQTFGIYTDIPMSLLAVAPFMTEGAKYWKEQVDKGIFVFLNGVGEEGGMPLVTIPELKCKIADAVTSEGVTAVIAEGKQQKENLDAQSKEIDNIINIYPFKDWLVEVKNQYMYAYSTESNEYKDIADKADAFITRLEQYDSAHTTSYAQMFPIIKKIAEKDVKIDKIKYEHPSDAKSITVTQIASDEKNIDKYNKYINPTTSYTNYINQKRGRNTKFYIYVIEKDKNVDYNKFIEETLPNVKKELLSKALNEENIYKDKLEQSFIEALGFTPSIANIFDMMFAHMDTFIHCFYGLMKNIKSQLDGTNGADRNARLKKTYDIQDGYTDTERIVRDGSPTNIERAKYLPPFTGFYHDVTLQGQTSKEAIWAGDMPNSSKLLEIPFVEDIVKAAMLYEEKAKEVEEHLETIATENVEGTMETNENSVDTTDIKLSIYMSIKSLYDKWLCSPPNGIETWSLEKVLEGTSDFNRFVYTDSMYHKIGRLLLVNLDKIQTLLDTCLPAPQNTDDTSVLIKTYGTQSLFEFMASVAEGCGGVLMAFPSKFGENDSNNNEDDIREMFTPFPIMQKWDDEQCSYLFLYSYKPSEHLGDTENGLQDMEGFTREGDGFNLTDDDIMGNFSDDGYRIPAFGVTIGKQNQSIFKNLTLNTESAGITEVNVAATMNIGSKNSAGARESTLYGQDLYSVYNQYSYQCEVECMGNMNILPVMYFQLNNIPMWKGTYMIKSVKHSIVAGNMTTHFTGTRLNRYAIPFSEGTFTEARLIGTELITKAAEEKIFQNEETTECNSDAYSDENGGENYKWKGSNNFICQCAEKMAEWYCSKNGFNGEYNQQRTKACPLIHNWSVRSDCSGFVSATLMLAGKFKNYSANSTFFAGNAIAGFTKIAFTSYSDIQEGDIVAMKGHVFIAAGDGRAWDYGNDRNYKGSGNMNKSTLPMKYIQKPYTTIWRAG